MAHFAVPRYVRFADALPKNQSQRIEKFRLRELGVGGAWDRDAARLRGAAVIGDWIRAKAAKNGDRVALEVAGETRTYNQLDANTDRTAAGFAALGLEPGDKCCLMMRNSAANVEAWLGLCKAGIVEVPINTANKGYLLEYIIRQSDARAIVCDAEFLPRIEEIEHSPRARDRRRAARRAGPDAHAAPERHQRDPLHARHHRPVARASCSATTPTSRSPRARSS